MIKIIAKSTTTTTKGGIHTKFLSKKLTGMPKGRRRINHYQKKTGGGAQGDEGWQKSVKVGEIQERITTFKLKIREEGFWVAKQRKGVIKGKKKKIEHRNNLVKPKKTRPIRQDHNGYRNQWDPIKRLGLEYGEKRLVKPWMLSMKGDVELTKDGTEKRFGGETVIWGQQRTPFGFKNLKKSQSKWWKVV